MRDSETKLFSYIFIFLIIEANLGFYQNQLSYYNKFSPIEKPNKLNYRTNRLSNQGIIDNNNHRLFWFIHITDTQMIWFENEKIEQLYEFFNSSFKEINPLFIYNTGDLVDAHNGRRQDVEEWKLYKKAIEDNKMNYSIYIDIAGNHDIIKDATASHYFNYSLIGSNFKTLQYSFNRTFSFGNYAFIGLNTAKSSYNLLEFAFIGFLNTIELDWYENELKKYKDFDKIFVFGHHPFNFPFPYLIKSSLSSSGKSFFDLNEEYNIFSYISGHVHTDYEIKENGIFSIITSNFDENNGTYRIISLDNNKLSTSVENVGKWPQALITNPINEEVIKKNNNKIRVLAWDPLGITSVKWGLTNLENETQINDWTPLIRVQEGDPLWEGDLEIQAEGKFLIKVKIESNSGEIIKEIIIHIKFNENIIFSIILLLILAIVISLSIIIIAIYSKIDFRKIKKSKKLQN
ncbi:MAG: metallophosphoesterase family protein [Promethearchaeota archaeon]